VRIRGYRPPTTRTAAEHAAIKRVQKAERAAEPFWLDAARGRPGAQAALEGAMADVQEAREALDAVRREREAPGVLN
jgi:hypothetical protein